MREALQHISNSSIGYNYNIEKLEGAGSKSTSFVVFFFPHLGGVQQNPNISDMKQSSEDSFLQGKKTRETENHNELRWSKDWDTNFRT